MQLVTYIDQPSLLILKGPYTSDQQTTIQSLVPAQCTVVFVGNEGVDTMDALLIQFTNSKSTMMVVEPSAS